MKGTDITQKARQTVTERDGDNGRLYCIYCGSPYGVELAHYVPRSRGGKGTPENLCPLCCDCHRIMDNGSDIKKREDIRAVCKDHLKRLYPGWDEEKVKVRKV